MTTRFVLSANGREWIHKNPSRATTIARTNALLGARGAITRETNEE